jgi:hypothetical protein
MIGLRPIGGTTMKRISKLQQNLFDVPTTVTVTRVPQDIQTAPLKPLVQALLTDLIDEQRRMAAVPGRKDEVKS